jgi:hypothetical protein
MILPTSTGNVPVSFNCSSRLPDNAKQLQQLKPKRDSKKQVSVQHHKPFLVYAYWGRDAKEQDYKDTAFIDGRGVCNSLR